MCRRSPQRLSISADILETRLLLTANGLDVTRGRQMIYNPDGPLSAPTSASAQQAALGYVTSHAADLGLTDGDVASIRVSRQHSDSNTGVSYIYLQQQYQGLDVESAEMSVVVSSNGAGSDPTSVTPGV